MEGFNQEQGIYMKSIGGSAKAIQLGEQYLGKNVLSYVLCNFRAGLLKCPF